MHASVILADHAQIADGKMFISGACWTTVMSGGSFAVAVILTFDPAIDERDGAGRTRQWRLVLEDANGAAVGELGLGGEFTIGGDDIVRMPMAFQMNSLALAPGRYRWQFVIDGLGDSSWGCDFLVVSAPAGPAVHTPLAGS